jgi:hypothetical protein
MTQKKLGNVPIVGHGVFLIDKIPGGVPYFALRVFLIVTNTDSVTLFKFFRRVTLVPFVPLSPLRLLDTPFPYPFFLLYFIFTYFFIFYHIYFYIYLRNLYRQINTPDVDTSRPPVGILINSTELCAAGFKLKEVLQRNRHDDPAVVLAAPASIRAPWGARWRLELLDLVSFHSCHTLRKQSMSAKPPTQHQWGSLQFVQTP